MRGTVVALNEEMCVSRAATKAAQDEVDELRKRVALAESAAAAGSGGGAGGASAAGESAGLTRAHFMEYGKTIMAKCMEIVRAKIGQVRETMQAYIDELTAERDALSANVDELQVQVHHWHDKFVDLNNKVVAIDRKWSLKDESDALI